MAFCRKNSGEQSSQAYKFQVVPFQVKDFFPGIVSDFDAGDGSGPDVFYGFATRMPPDGVKRIQADIPQKHFTVFING
jgi:hypothetical protein